MEQKLLCTKQACNHSLLASLSLGKSSFHAFMQTFLNVLQVLRYCNKTHSNAVLLIWFVGFTHSASSVLIIDCAALSCAEVEQQGQLWIQLGIWHPDLHIGYSQSLGKDHLNGGIHGFPYLHPVLVLYWVVYLPSPWSICWLQVFDRLLWSA
jgi:hypothetical protein